jgi:hypothetical protein
MTLLFTLDFTASSKNCTFTFSPAAGGLFRRNLKQILIVFFYKNYFLLCGPSERHMALFCIIFTPLLSLFWWLDCENHSGTIILIIIIMEDTKSLPAKNVKMFLKSSFKDDSC